MHINRIVVIPPLTPHMVPPLDWPPLSLSPFPSLSHVIPPPSSKSCHPERYWVDGSIPKRPDESGRRHSGQHSRMSRPTGRQPVQWGTTASAGIWNFSTQPTKIAVGKIQTETEAWRRRGAARSPLLLRCPISLVSTFCPLKKTAAHVPFPLPRDSCLVSPLSLRVCCGLRPRGLRLRKKRPGK